MSDPAFPLFDEHEPDRLDFLADEVNARTRPFRHRLGRLFEEVHQAAVHNRPALRTMVSGQVYAQQKAWARDPTTVCFMCREPFSPEERARPREIHAHYSSHRVKEWSLAELVRLFMLGMRLADCDLYADVNHDWWPEFHRRAVTYEPMHRGCSFSDVAGQETVEEIHARIVNMELFDNPARALEWLWTAETLEEEEASDDDEAGMEESVEVSNMDSRDSEGQRAQDEDEDDSESGIDDSYSGGGPGHGMDEDEGEYEAYV